MGIRMAPQLTRFALIVQRRWWAILVAAVAAVATANVFVSTQAPTYRSSVKLEVTGRIDYGQILAIDKLLRQISARITTTAVAEAIDERLQLDIPPESLLGKIRTQAISDTIQIQVDIEDVEAGRAERIARAVAELVQERQTAQMASVPEPERVYVTMLDRPTPARFVWPDARSILLAAAMLGALVGALVTFVLDFLDDTIRSPEDAHRHLGLPVVGAIPPAAGPAAGAIPAVGRHSPGASRFRQRLKSHL